MPSTIERAAASTPAVRPVPDQPGETFAGSGPRTLVPRAVLAVPLLAGALWYALLALDAGARGLGLSPAHTVARAIAAIVLAPVCVAFAVALLDGAQCLLRGRRSAVTWSRIMTEALAALVLGAFTGVLEPAVWLGLAALGLAAALGLLFGLRRWRPQAAIDERTFVPLALLLFDEPPAPATRPVVVPARERRAA
jgi:hypothetical protein